MLLLPCLNAGVHRWCVRARSGLEAREGSGKKRHNPEQIKKEQAKLEQRHREYQAMADRGDPVLNPKTKRKVRKCTDCKRWGHQRRECPFREVHGSRLTIRPHGSSLRRSGSGRGHGRSSKVRTVYSMRRSSPVQ